MLSRDVVPTAGEGNTLILVFHDQVQAGYFEKEEHLQEIKDAIQRQIQKEVDVRVKYMNETGGQMDQMIDLTHLTKMPIDFED